MEEVISRRKKVYRMKRDEILNGEWIKTLFADLKSDELFEIIYRNGFLTIVIFKTSKKGGIENERIGKN